MSLSISRQVMPLPRRAALIAERLDACPKTSGYTKRRNTLLYYLDLYTSALDKEAQTKAAEFKMNTRRAFSVGLN